MSIIFSLALFGVVVWLILQLPMPEPFPKIIIVAASIIAIMYVLKSTGMVHGALF